MSQHKPGADTLDDMFGRFKWLERQINDPFIYKVNASYHISDSVL